MRSIRDDKVCFPASGSRDPCVTNEQDFAHTTMTNDSGFADIYRDALALHRAGNLDEAERLYRTILNAEGNHGGALYGLGTVCVQRGMWEDAVRILDLSLAVAPNQPTALNNRGVALEKLKRYDGALASYERAIALRPDYAEAFNNRGNVLRDIGRADEALLSYERAIALKPDSAEAVNNRGNSLYDLRRLEEALLSYDRAIALKPHYVEAFNNRGNVLRGLRRLDEALLSYERAIALRSDYFEAFNNRGNALYDLARLDEALLSYERAIALKSDYTDALVNRGNTLRDLGRAGDALSSYERALALKPDAAYLEGLILHARMAICDWAGLESGIARVLEGIERGAKACAPFAALALPSTPAQQRQCAEIYARNEFPPIAQDSAKSSISFNDRIRLGYFSADFHEHPVSYLAAELFELHDRSRFEVFGFSCDSAPEDGMRKRLRSGFDRFVEVAGNSDREVAAIAQDVGIDIAIDLGGYTEHSRLGILAHRPAPIQVHYLGYPGTLGAPFIDYLIADRTVVPEEHQRFYSEKIAYLSGSYLVSDAKRRIADRVFARAELGLPPAGFVFCCFNNQYKIEPAVFDVWTRLLRQVEGSVLWLSAGNATAAANLRKEAAARGVATERIVFAQRINSSAEHLARLRAADLFVDTFSYNAHTTASDALWAGLPVLTCLGGAFAGRVAASLLNAVGLPEMIACSHEEYEARAHHLATHPAELGAIRQKLSGQRLTYPLFDTPRFARSLEDAYTQMWKRRQEGLAPEHIHA